MAKYRGGRINEELKKEISNIIQYKIRDPRIHSMISVTYVDVTKDLRYAKVYISVFGSEEERQETLKILKHSAGFIRKEVGRNISLRYIPELLIELDESINRGMKIEAILGELKGVDNHDE